MKKVLLSLVLFFAVFAGFSMDASAKDLTRRFGLGVDSTITNFVDDGRGISVVYYVSKFFGMQLIFGVETFSAKIKPEGADAESKSGNGNWTVKELKTTVTEWNVTFRGLIPFVLTSDVNLTAVVGFTASGRSSDGFKSTNELYAKYNDGYQFAIDLGVRPEWFVTEHFSIHTQVGVGIQILTHSGTSVVYGISTKNGDTIVPSTKASGVHTSFFKNVDLLGQAGFTFWF